MKSNKKSLALFMIVLMTLFTGIITGARGSGLSGGEPHFVPVWENNPYQPMNIIITEATKNGIPLQAGDEIGVFDVDENGDLYCVGMITLEQDLTTEPVAIRTSADDPTTSGLLDGFVSGHEIIFKIWDSEGLQEIEEVVSVYVPDYDDVYRELGTAVVSIAGASGIPDYNNVEGDTIEDGESKCYNARKKLTVSGPGEEFVIMSGGEVRFISGDTLILKPGFHATEGSYLRAFIATDESDFCNTRQAMVPSPPDEETYEELVLDIEEAFLKEGDRREERDAKVYPNPTSGSLTIDFNGAAPDAAIKVVNFQGLEVYRTNSSRAFSRKINLGSLPPGVYVLIVTYEGYQISKKIIKSN